MLKAVVRYIILTIVALIVAFVAFLAGAVYGAGTNNNVEYPSGFPLFLEAWSILKNNYIDTSELQDPDLTHGAIEGLLQSLDDTGTGFLSEDELTAQNESVGGEYPGIGVNIDFEDSLPLVTIVYEGGPAEQAGVKRGDLIIEINGVSARHLSLEEIIELVRGEKGTEVTLTLARTGVDKYIDVTVIRDTIDIPNVTWAMIPDTEIALVRLSGFSDKVENQLITALKEALDDGATKFIIDVRDNPGGSFEQAINVTNQFLQDGTIITQESLNNDEEVLSADAEAIVPDLPVVVLINQNSAGSAEIFAGAIRDNDRGLVIGESSFGLGTVSHIFTLRDGSGVRVSTAQWRTPKGHLIRNEGIKPDIVVEMHIYSPLLSPAKLIDMSEAELLRSEDTQLLRALEELE